MHILYLTRFSRKNVVKENEEKAGYLVTFPQHLTKAQVEQLKIALQNAVVSVSKRIELDDVNVQPKINDFALGGKRK